MSQEMRREAHLPLYVLGRKIAARNKQREGHVFLTTLFPWVVFIHVLFIYPARLGEVLFAVLRCRYPSPPELA